MKKMALDELGRISLEEFHRSEKSSIVVVLDNIRSQHNIGSIFRTSDAFRIEKIYLCGITATALGSTESVAWEYSEHTTDAIRALKKAGYIIASIEQVEGSKNLVDFIPDPSKKYALVFGNEIKGVEQEIIDESDMCLEIPQFGTKHSFNVSVTAGIVLYDMFNKMKK